MSKLHRHNPTQDVLTVNGSVIRNSDLAGDPIEFVRLADNEIEGKPGINGSVQAMVVTDRRAQLTVVVWEGSDAHKYMLVLQASGIELVVTYKKGGVETPVRVGTQGYIQNIRSSTSEDAKATIEIVTATYSGG